MTWTHAQRQKYRQQLFYSGRKDTVGVVSNAKVPDDVQRVESHEPCGFCNVARGPCRHRPWLEAVA